MKLLYTGSKSKKHEQKDPLLSLGGVVGSSQVPDDFFNSMFQEIGSETIKNNKKEVICLALENDSDKEYDVTSIFFAQTRGSYAKYRLGVVEGKIDLSCGDVFLPKIPNKFSLPVGVEFNNITSVMGETEIIAGDEIENGTEIFIKVNGVTVSSFILDRVLNDQIYDLENNGFFLRREFDRENKIFKVFLVQEDVLNFDDSVSLVDKNDQSISGVLTHHQPIVNKVSFSNFKAGETSGLFVERTLKNEIVRELKKDDKGNLLFALNSVEGAELNKEEIAKIVIEYEEVQQ